MRNSKVITRTAVVILTGLSIAISAAGASVVASPILDNAGGQGDFPTWGMQIDRGNQGESDIFSFQDGSGSSTVTLSIDTETGKATLTGLVRHGKMSWDGLQYSGETWNYEAELQLLSDWTPGLASDLADDPAALGKLNFRMESSTFKLASGLNARDGYSGPTQWIGSATTAGAGHQLSSTSSRNECTFQGWFAPFGHDGPSMIQNFRCAAASDNPAES